jgi:hypothetical protein
LEFAVGCCTLAILMQTRQSSGPWIVLIVMMITVLAVMAVIAGSRYLGPLRFLGGGVTVSPAIATPIMTPTPGLVWSSEKHGADVVVKVTLTNPGPGEIDKFSLDSFKIGSTVGVPDVGVLYHLPAGATKTIHVTFAGLGKDHGERQFSASATYSAGAGSGSSFASNMEKLP